MLMLLILLLALVSVGAGGWGFQRYGWAGMTPAGAIMLLAAILYFTGNFHTQM